MYMYVCAHVCACMSLSLSLSLSFSLSVCVCVQELLKAKADTNIKDSFGSTAGNHNFFLKEQ